MQLQGIPALRSAAALVAVALASSGCLPPNDGPTQETLPVARDDTAAVAYRGRVQIPVLANDAGAAGDALSLQSVGPPAHGAAWFTGSYAVYEPSAGFSGEDAFTYTIANLSGRTATATVHVTVGSNTPPVARSLFPQPTPEDTPLDLTLDGSDVEDVPSQLTVEVVAAPGHGTLQLAASTSAPRLATYTPAPDWSGLDSFSYRVVDRDGAASAPVVVQLSVEAVNDPPIATAIAPLVTAEDTAVDFTLTATDVDTPVGSLVIWVDRNPAHGRVLFTGGNSVPVAARYVPDPDFAGTDSFTFYAYDGVFYPVAGESAPVTVQITVTPVNDPPVATGRTVSGSEDVPLTVLLTGTDLESPSRDLRVEVLSLPVHGTIAPTSGSAPLSVLYTPEPGWSGTDRFGFRVVDPQGALSDPAEVTLSIAAVNDPPVATLVPPVVTEEDVPVTFTLTGTDPDDAVSALVVSLVSAPSRGTLSAASGIAPLTVTWTPPANWSGSDSFAFRVRDPSGALSAPVTVSLTVNAVNDAPVTAPDVATVCGGASVRIPVLRNDSDLDLDVLAVVSVGQGLLGTVVIDGSELLYSATPGVIGTDAFMYTASDGRASATGIVTVNVLGPELLSQVPASGTTGGPLQIWGRCLGTAQGTVTIGGRPAPVTTWTPRYVVATVPTDFAPGVHDLLVTPAGGAPLLGSYEIVPWIGLVEPWQVAPGEPQAIVGDGFVTPAGTVGYGPALAAIDGWTGTGVQSRMPAPGRWNLSLTTSTGAASNVYPVTGTGPDTWWTERVPAGRSGHSAVWTGTEMIVFGGVRAGTVTFLDDGGRYDPRHDAWVPISAAGLTSGRVDHAAVWTGAEMIVWGGVGSGGYTATGGRYQPGADRWTAVAATAAPVARSAHTAVWTGSRMIVWGGRSASGYRSDGASYDPAADQWVAMTTTGAPAGRYAHAAVWTGKEMIVWGGNVAGSGAVATGARYDPATDRWTPMSTAGAPQPRTDMAAIWTGEELVVWGGFSSASQPLADGGRYDPATDTWRPLAGAGAPEGRAHPAAIWTGRELVVWGGNLLSGVVGSGARYDPVTDAWAPIAAGAAPLARGSHTGVWTGAELIVWGGAAAGSPLDTGGRYDPVADRWTPTRSGTPGEPAARRDHAWACLPGGDLVVWGGNVAGVVGDDATGARYRAATADWAPLASAGAPSPREGATAVWTGTHVVVWGGRRVQSGSTTYLGDGARYDPALDEWTALATTGAPSARSGHSATWSGGRMIVFGGRNASSVLATGAAYDPVTDRWEPLPTLNAPAARQLHTAVDAGGEVIVFGGEAITGAPHATGASFHVADWVWTALPAGPAARTRHTAVWTGDEMLVVGGSTTATGTTGLAAGGRYIPRLGAWGSLDAPVAVYGHGAVFTGNRLVVWGGSSALGPFTYDPLTRGWTTSAAPGAAPVRDRPSMCWTGSEVVIWGGATGGSGVGALGRYRP